MFQVMLCFIDEETVRRGARTISTRWHGWTLCRVSYTFHVQGRKGRERCANWEVLLWPCVFDDLLLCKWKRARGESMSNRLDWICMRQRPTFDEKFRADAGLRKMSREFEDERCVKQKRWTGISLSANHDRGCLLEPRFLFSRRRNREESTSAAFRFASGTVERC